jgi:DNA-binding CsgD family transcriptional regulator
VTGLPFVGRREELDAVLRAWRAVPGDPDRARVVVVTGDAGTGKSRLVAEAVERLVPRPARVLSGQARTHAPAPYDWMASALSGHDLTDLPLPQDALAWLTQRPNLPARRLSPEALLRVAVDAVRALLSTSRASDPAPEGTSAGGTPGGMAAGRTPATGVLVVEDLHDLDPASLDLVSELASADRLPVLLLVTSRTPGQGAFPDLAARVLTRLTGTPRSSRWHLGPLAVPDVAAMIEAGLGTPPDHAEPADLPELSDLAAETHRRTGGNPRWLTELLVTCRAAAADGPGRLAQLATAALPDYLGAIPTSPAAPTSPSPSSAPSSGGGVVATVAAVEVLTAREREVVRCLAAGMTNRQVARELGISIRTVTVHVSNLFRKTGAASRTEAALWAMRQGLAD